MSYSEPARTTYYRTRIRRGRVAGLLAVVAVIAAVLDHQLPASSSGPGASPSHFPHSQHPGALGEANGSVPDGTSVFDDGVPGVAKLDPDLRSALRQAATAAADEGVRFVVD